MNKDKDLEFIKTFNEITISKMCKKFNANNSNLSRGQVSGEKVHKITKEIQKEILKILLKYID